MPVSWRLSTASNALPEADGVDGAAVDDCCNCCATQLAELPLPAAALGAGGVMPLSPFSSVSIALDDDGLLTEDTEKMMAEGARIGSF